MITQTRATRFASSTPELLKRLQQRLPKRYRLIAQRPIVQPAVVLDTFNDAIWRQGKVLLNTESELLLLGGQALACTLPKRTAIGFKRDIADEKLRMQLDAVPEIRRLLPQPGFTVSQYHAAVVDDDNNTCAQLVIMEVESKSGSAGYVELLPLRADEKPYRLLYESLLQLDAELDSMPTGMFEKLGYRPHNYLRNPSISLHTDITVEAASIRIITTYIDVARLNEDGIIRDLDPEFLHDYRVSLRRVRSLMSLFKGVWLNQYRQDLKQRFGDLMRITNRLRDLDVYLLDQPSYYALLPETIHEGVDQIFTAFRRERRQQWRKLAVHLQSDDYQQEVESLRALFEPGGGLEPGNRAGEQALVYARTLIRKHYKRACRIARRIDDTTAYENIHELRIQCKKLRYLLDFFAPLLDQKSIPLLLDALKKLQDNLGRFNDYSGQKIALQEFLDQQLKGSKKVSPKMIEALDALIALKHQMQLKERAQLMESLANFHSKETKKLIHDLCSTATGETLPERPATVIEAASVKQPRR